MIAKHDNQANVMFCYQILSHADRQDLINFLRSL